MEQWNSVEVIFVSPELKIYDSSFPYLQNLAQLQYNPRYCPIWGSVGEM
jgi:hypothetical protein